MDVLDRDDLPFPQSLTEFQRLFPDEAACADYLEKARWRDGFVCPHCSHQAEPFRFANRPAVLRCRKCERDTGLAVSTVMQRSHTPLSIGTAAVTSGGLPDREVSVPGRTVRAELDDATAIALDELVRQERRPRSHVLTAALKAFLEFSPAARLALFAIDGFATEDERAAAMALIGQSVIDAYQEILDARQGAGAAEQEPDIEALLSL